MKAEGKKKRQYLISLEIRYSVVALIAGIIIFICATGAIFVKFALFDQTGNDPIHLFTVRSNMLTATAAAFMIPFAVEGIRKKRFVLPRWIVLIQYTCTLCVAITMLTTLLFILPVKGSSAVTGTEFWLHIVSPLCTLALFQCVESGIAFTKKEMVIVQIPFWIYMATYYVKVVVIGKEHGGWSDFYMTMRFWPAWVSIILFLAIGFAVSAVLRLVQNWRVRKSYEITTRLWTDDMGTADLLVEAFVSVAIWASVAIFTT